MPKRSLPVGFVDCVEPACPVGNVSFFDALEYSNWLSQREQLMPCYELSGCIGEIGLDLRCTTVRLTSDSAYDCEGYRLPTESEWEYATRAGTTTALYAGGLVSTVPGDCVDEPGMDALGWYCRNSDMRAHPVAQKLPNAWGLYDLHGNVAEWVNDLYDGGGYGAGPLVDPRGTRTPGRDLMLDPTEMELRVVRGGAFSVPGESCASSNRHSGPSRGSSPGLGLRLVRTLASQAP